tara:strand:- start:167 stop:403 length:237 start_codon:yes stop_codon:yes gene_type:complete
MPYISTYIRQGVVRGFLADTIKIVANIPSAVSGHTRIGETKIATFHIYLKYCATYYQKIARTNSIGHAAIAISEFFCN